MSEFLLFNSSVFVELRVLISRGGPFFIVMMPIEPWKNRLHLVLFSTNSIPVTFFKSLHDYLFRYLKSFPSMLLGGKGGDTP